MAATRFHIAAHGRYLLLRAPLAIEVGDKHASSDGVPLMLWPARGHRNFGELHLMIDDRLSAPISFTLVAWR